MSGRVDPEALLPREDDAPRKRQSSRLPPWLSSFSVGAGRLLRIRGIPRLAVFGGLFFFVSVILLSTRPGHPVRKWVKDKYYTTAGVTGDLDLDTPPRYLDLIKEQANLPQHNLSLPYPEGATGRYVKFTSQINMLGWNNVLNELLMLTHLAYKSRRAYVFQDYVWKQDYYPWPESKAWDLPSRTPLPALISGPTVGGPWESGDSAPRSIHEKHWDVVCPKSKVKVIWTHEVKRAHKLHWEKTGKEIFAVWNKILLEETEKCIEVIAPQRDVEDFGQVFDLWLWGTDRILDIWEEFRDSPTSQLLKTSPVVQRAIDRNEHLFKSPETEHHDPFSRVLAVHVRRGDYVGACSNLANYNSTFYSWNLHPWLPDRFGPLPGGEPGKNTPENIKEYFVHCLPDEEQIIKRISAARDDWEKEVFGDRLEGHFITTLYILTNAKSQWLDDFIVRLEKEHKWRIITTNDLTFGDSQEKDVGMAVDMELARKSAIFMGNGWSSFTSNILHRRLVDKKIPISNRFF
ncbi:hypothetical protein DFP72DRAFT_927787 [Ephemerocybe angulata]|uniref:Uncharacterized protein n=1 Tax=Ephemerocybe angulata TaxID=980116 RepID=A0A8H6HE40_9AGAR|nr:hypothetical protein DFP72DRAFT_927787 [Tulosesus angulatus]